MKIRIEAETLRPGGTRLYLNDVLQEHITSVEFRHAVGEIASLKINYFGHRCPWFLSVANGLRYVIQEMRTTYRA